MVSTIIAKSDRGSSRTRFFKRYENEVDEYGFNVTPYKFVESFVRLLYKKWFGVQIAGLKNIPADGSVVLFGNHSGVLPIDGCLLYDGIVNNHPEPRRSRFLVTKFLLNAPILGKMLRGFGCIPPEFDSAAELLRRGDLVYFYPEAEKGTGKLFKDRYNLVDFHSGFVRAAIATGSPIIPVVTIGGEEIYPLLGNIKPIAKLMNAPYFPVTPFFPWLGPIGMIPLPIKIMMCVWRPFKLNYPPESADNEELVAEIVRDIQNDMQVKVNGLLAMRESPFKKWDMQQVYDYLENTESYSPSLNKHRVQS